MAGVHFLVSIGSHHMASCCWLKIIVARMFVTSKRISSEKSWTTVDGVRLAVSFEDRHVDQARIHPAIPCRRNRVRPCAGASPADGLKASQRSPSDSASSNRKQVPRPRNFVKVRTSRRLHKHKNHNWPNQKTRAKTVIA